MEASVIHYRLDLVIRLIDTTTGTVVEERNVRFSNEGEALHPIPRGSGNYVFLNNGRKDFDMHIEVYGYESTWLRVQYETLDDSLPILEVFLIPSENLLRGERLLSLSGRISKLQAIDAVKLGTTQCCTREFDERKKIMTLFKVHGLSLEENEYGLVHKQTQDFEVIGIQKVISENSVKLSEPLHQEFSKDDPITRIVHGKVDQNGEYILRVRDDAEHLEYLVRYVTPDETKFKVVDFHNLD